MTESDSILQLGIEAAREGNKEEARNLFRLITRQDPEHVQAWLWLAGVAETREERLAALERVRALDPSNELAKKGLQALQSRNGESGIGAPTEGEDESAIASALPTESEKRSAQVDAAAGLDDDNPFAALDDLSDAFSEAPTSVRRGETSSEAATAATAAATAGAASSYSGRAAPKPDTEDEEPVRGVSPLLLVGAAIVVVLLLVVFFFPRATSNNAPTFPQANQTGTTLAGVVITGTSGITPSVIAATELIPTETSVAMILPTSEPPTALPATEVPPTALPATAVPPTEEVSATTVPAEKASATPVPTPEVPSAVAATPAPVTQTTSLSPTTASPVPSTVATGGTTTANINPTIVPPNTPQESNGWTYDFNAPNMATMLWRQPGGVAPQGRYALVVVYIINRTGKTQVIPADFFMLKDAQGRLYTPLPEISRAYVQPGINADASLLDPIVANGVTNSVAIIFDVAPDATNMVFFARSKPEYGWLVINAAQ